MPLVVETFGGWSQNNQIVWLLTRAEAGFEQLHTFSSDLPLSCGRGMLTCGLYVPPVMAPCIDGVL